MTDLNALLKDVKDSRLAWLTIRRDKEEALLSGIVEEIEALKALANPPRMTNLPPETVLAMAEAGPGGITYVDADMKPVKRGPGRPKAEAA